MLVCFSDDPPEERVQKARENTRAEWGRHWGRPVFLRIIKEDSLLELWVQGEGKTWGIAKKYPIRSYGGEIPPKQEEGDGRAPEGFYRVSLGRLNPASHYHLAFNIGYPNRYDREHGRTGSNIMVHGSYVSIGCFAMGDEAIEEIYIMVEQALRRGQAYVPVQIYPFRMTSQRMEQEKEEEHRELWQHLEEGWRYTEQNRQPFPDKDS